MAKDKEIMKRILREHPGGSELYRRTVLKEYIQILVLDFIYSNDKYKSLVFYGGTCLAHCYGLPRLSEDLDFVDTNKSISLDVFAIYLSLIYYLTRGRGVLEILIQYEIFVDEH